MSRSLLGLIDQASGEMGLAQPASVIGIAINQTMQLLALTQRLGLDLVREFQWNQLVKAYIFQTTAAQTKLAAVTAAGTTTMTVQQGSAVPVAGMVLSGTGIAPYTELVSFTSSGPNYILTLSMPTTAAIAGNAVITFAYQDYAMPSDYDRMIADSSWDRTNHWRNLGTKSSQEWQTLQGGLISVGPRERFRVYANKLRIFPALTSVSNMAFEYVSNYWVLASGDSAATKSSFTIDTDTAIFPDDLMLAGIKYYFLRAKKLDFGIELAEFNNILDVRKSQDVPIPAQSLAPIRVPELVGPWSIADGNWPTSSI